MRGPTVDPIVGPNVLSLYSFKTCCIKFNIFVCVSSPNVLFSSSVTIFTMNVGDMGYSRDLRAVFGVYGVSHYVLCGSCGFLFRIFKTICAWKRVSWGRAMEMCGWLQAF